jgi:hypothetical protein
MSAMICAPWICSSHADATSGTSRSRSLPSHTTSLGSGFSLLVTRPTWALPGVEETAVEVTFKRFDGHEPHSCRLYFLAVDGRLECVGFASGSTLQNESALSHRIGPTSPEALIPPRRADHDLRLSTPLDRTGHTRPEAVAAAAARQLWRCRMDDR